MAIANYIKINNLDSILEAWEAAPDLATSEIASAINKSTQSVQNLARAATPRRTGALAESISSITTPTKGYVYVPPTIKYAVYVSEGTGLYGKYHTLIVPTNAKVLATKINPGWGSANANGYYIIGKSSQGQKPNPFMTKAAEAGKTVVNNIFLEAQQNILDGISI